MHLELKETGINTEIAIDGDGYFREYQMMEHTSTLEMENLVLTQMES